MKKNLLLPTIILLTVSCTNENIPAESPQAGKEITITATQNGTITRMSHEDDGAQGLTVAWEEGDQFALYRGTDGLGQTFTIPTNGVGTDGKTATFAGTTPAGTGDAYYAFFPAAAAERKWQDNHFSVLGQVIDADAPTAHLERYNYMTAALSTDPGTEISEINFSHLIAILQFDITLPGNIAPRSITLRTTDDRDGAGIAIRKKLSDGTITTAKQLTAVITGATDGFATTAYLAVLPSTLTQELALAVTNNLGQVYNYTVSFSGSHSYEAGNVYNATLDYTSAGSEYGTAQIFGDGTTATEITPGDDGVYLITTAGELKWFADQVNGRTNFSGKTIRLMTDIQVIATTWTPIGSNASFNGTFDGNGHTISGKLTAPPSGDYLGFFGNINGATITGLHVSADVQGGTMQNHVSAVAAYASSNSSISYCTVSGTVTCGYTGSSANCVGGIAGYFYSTNTISHCTMTGDVTSSTAATGEVFAGGIMGLSNGNKNNSITHCTNSGAVTASGSISVFAGGILGGYDTVSFCRNSGSVSGTTSATSGSVLYVGGIAGYTTSIHTSHNTSTAISGTAENGATKYIGRLAGSADAAYDCCTSVEISGLNDVGNNTLTSCDDSHN